ncbi:MAG TPA: ABC transporter ATP-binding protein [Stellaceae bacterium]|nr:ABC transporter ATP-binding protein [Stellaceae bacterium]
MSRLVVEGVRREYGPVRALDGVGLAVEPGELLTILGPSGSGKTTLLKVIAGFETPETGSVLLGGEDITAVPPARRNIGMVFQNYALFPHMTAAQNIAFPLEMRGMARTEIDREVVRALDLVALGGLGERLPRQLSGGQQQRVALARAVVFNPRLLLLDEPFGALDRKLREAMQLEVRRLQRRLGLTTIFITHDQEEALVISDRVAVMRAGRIEQVGRPPEIYERPANSFVAEFVGESNLLFGTVGARKGDDLEIGTEDALTVIARGEAPAGARVGMLVRPERLIPGEAGRGTVNLFRGRVLETVYVGSSHKFRIRLDGGRELLVRAPAMAERGAPAVGDGIAVRFAPEDVHLFRQE